VADDDVFVSREDIRGRDYVIATYLIRTPPGQDPMRTARAFAVGQTIGTWVEVPGVTRRMREENAGRVVGLVEVPAVDVDASDAPEPSHSLVSVALPVVNFGVQFPMLLTTLLGNDASTSTLAKLVDLEFPDAFLREMGGPAFGIAGIRDLVDVPVRPLLLNMIKPCTGLSPKDGARIFYETALGGVDLIKDDELLGNPPFSPAVERVKEYGAAAKAAYETTGKDVVYIVNVTDSPDRVIDGARRCVDAGARAVMVNYALVGYGVLSALVRAVDVPVMGHFAGAGVFYEGAGSGMSAALATGALVRLAGADIAMTLTPYGGYPLRSTSYRRTIQELTVPRPHLVPTMPAIGGGVHPGFVERYIRELGNDIILSPGGGIHGHPGGSAAGARAMLQAIEAVLAGRPVAEAAREHEELATALELWGDRST
jgi:2,3-diketo-5-methylthiopentyl-1-phosphate enolase